MSSLTFADEAVLPGNSEHLQRFVSEFDWVCKRWNLKVNVGKSKVMCLKEV